MKSKNKQEIQKSFKLNLSNLKSTKKGKSNLKLSEIDKSNYLNDLIDETMNETFDFVAKLNQDYNDENSNNLNNKNQQVRKSTRHQKLIKDDKTKDDNIENGGIKVNKIKNIRIKENEIVSDETNLDLDKSTISNNRSRKRKLSELTDNQQPTKKTHRKVVPLYLFFELQLTATRPTEEIVKFCAYQNSENNIFGFVRPTVKRMTEKMKKQTGISVKDRLMFYNEVIVEPKPLEVLLTEFVEFLESYRSNNIILVFENPLKLNFIPIILINNLRKFNLLDRVHCLIDGFIDANDLFSIDEKPFNLDLSGNKIKSTFTRLNPLYGLDLLTKYFNSRFNLIKKNQDNVIRKFEDVRIEASAYYKESDVTTVVDNQLTDLDPEDEQKFETIEDILKEAEKIRETKTCLTVDELRNLYLLQKFKYQYIYSKTYNPMKKAFPRIKPKKKNNNNVLKTQSIKSVNKNNQGKSDEDSDSTNQNSGKGSQNSDRKSRIEFIDD